MVAMAGYNFEIKYVHRSDNKVTVALNQVGGHLDEDVVKELLDQDAIKELLSMLHATEFHEQKRTTLHLPRNMRRRKGRSSCRLEYWQK